MEGDTSSHPLDNEYHAHSPPVTRDSSPSPSISPTPALLACPPLDRCFSTNSTGSEFSGRSSASRSSTGSAVSRRRGYVRPQGAAFSDSARNRDSVMSLGSIAHLQYYFARTGILDGKGAQLARGDMKKRDSSLRVSIVDPSQVQDTGLASPSPLGGEIVQSPIEEEGEMQDWEEPLMLPPTVSTYSHRTTYIPPPPDSATLRRELEESLDHVGKALADVTTQKTGETNQTAQSESDLPDDLEEAPESGPKSPGRGWHEIQGMHMLDVVTLAIRSAKDYYTGHEHPDRLAKVKSERRVREELLGVLDALKRMATRHFAGGMKKEELSTISDWVAGVGQFLVAEKAVEEQEARDRISWKWLEGDWTGSERLREWNFLKTFIEDEEMPEWTDPSCAEHLPTPFLAAMSSGLTLVRLHNRILKKSKRQFGDIDAFHTDTAKPYRAADNLRYWIKAAEIRWETKLQVDVMGLVYNKGQDVWRDFDAAIMEWSRVSREEITNYWKAGSVQVTLPVLIL